MLWWFQLQSLRYVSSGTWKRFGLDTSLALALWKRDPTFDISLAISLQKGRRSFRPFRYAGLWRVTYLYAYLSRLRQQHRKVISIRYTWTKLVPLPADRHQLRLCRQEISPSGDKLTIRSGGELIILADYFTISQTLDERVAELSTCDLKFSNVCPHHDVQCQPTICRNTFRPSGIQ
jgi:hypothetical protein